MFKKGSLFLTVLFLLFIVTGVSADTGIIESGTSWHVYNGDVTVSMFPLMDGRLAYITLDQYEISLNIGEAEVGETGEKVSFGIDRDYIKNIMVTSCGKKIWAVINYDYSDYQYPREGGDSMIYEWTLVVPVPQCGASKVYFPYAVGDSISTSDGTFTIVTGEK